jgi:5-methyltetrahydropteroyltriglutamate--homocysteine methyltransferase
VAGEPRAETVGSMLRTDDIVAAAHSAPGDADAANVLDEAVLEAVKLQEEVGLDVITDGEMRRVAWAQTPRFVDCFVATPGRGQLNWRVGAGQPADPGRPGGSQPQLTNAIGAGGIRAGGGYPTVVQRVTDAPRTGSMTEEYAFLARHAHSRTKFTMPAPSYHRRYWSPEHSTQAYRNCEEFLADIRDYQRGVVSDLAAIGCDYVQLDAPNYGSLCDPDTRARMRAEGRDLEAETVFDAELDSSLFDGIHGVTTALHICRGNGPGGAWHSAGGYGAISGQLFPRLSFDRLLLEYDSDRAGTFGPLADARPGTVVVLGLLTTKSDELDDVARIEARIAEAARLRPLAELALSTQCGFASVPAGNPVSPEGQRAKLELVASVAHRIWGR